MGVDGNFRENRKSVIILEIVDGTNPRDVSTPYIVLKILVTLNKASHLFHPI